jgi:hypothetical protein
LEYPALILQLASPRDGEPPLSRCIHDSGITESLLFFPEIDWASGTRTIATQD